MNTIKFKVCHLNIASLTAHFNEFRDHILHESYDVVGVGETNLKPHVASSLVQIETYNFYRWDRVGRDRGGVGLYIKSSVPHQVLELYHDVMECLWMKIKLKTEIITLGCIYRPPDFPVKLFVSEFESILTDLLPQTDHLICFGDTNLNLFDPDEYGVRSYVEVLDGLGLKQIIEEPTRVSRTSTRLIDHLIISEELDVLHSEALPLGISDHDLICAVVNLETVSIHVESVTYRDLKGVDLQALYDSLRSIPWKNLFDLNDIDEKIKFFNSTMQTLMDLHAPLRTVALRKKNLPWITANIKLMIKLRDKAKFKFKNDKTEENHRVYKDLRNYTNKMIRNEKRIFLEQQFNTKNSKSFWKSLRNLNILTKKHSLNIPNHLSDPNEINKFFINSIPSSNVSPEVRQYYENPATSSEKFRFYTVTENDISKYLTQIRTRAVGSDGIHVNFLIFCCPFILKFICHLVNFCITQSVFPSEWKLAHVVPLPKKDNPKSCSDLRPISILPILSKIIERVLKNQIIDYVEEENLIDITQSGFRKGHGCSTALLNVTDDIFRAIDNNNCTILVLLDYSKAFDTINHDTLLVVLEYLGFHRSSLKLIRDYLYNRKQRVVLGGVKSDYLDVKSGVPQGSILGPILFILYTSRFSHFLKQCKIQKYADDTQIYHSFPPSSLIQGCDFINEDLKIIEKVSKDHALHLNASKSVVLFFGRPIEVKRLTQYVSVKIGEAVIPVKTEAKNLGLILDNELRFKKHISVCIQKCISRLRILFNSRRILSQKIKKLLCDSMILSIFNHCDVVYGPCLTAETSEKIQRIQKYCMRFIYGIRRGRPVSHMLTIANWTNMRDRRYIHRCSLYHKIIKLKYPQYLFQKITFRTDVNTLNLRLNGIIIPSHKTGIYERSFTYDLAKNFNDLPASLQSCSISVFSKLLKLYISA